MKEIRAAYYKSKLFDGHILDNLISGYTWFFNPLTPNVSHEEKWFPDKHGNFIVNGKIVGRCFSSTMRGDAKGCRWDRAAKILRNPKRWLIKKQWVSDNEYHNMIVEANQMVANNKGYNIKGILVGFFTLKPRHGTVGKYYCSQACAWLEFYAKVTKKWVIRISPRRSYKRHSGKSWMLEYLKD